MRHSYVNCPKCGNLIHQAVGAPPRYYGDPHVTCPKCGAPFLDPWVIELAFFPKDWYVKHHRKALVFLAIWVIPFLITIQLIKWKCPVIIPLIISLIIPGICSAMYTSKTTRISVNEDGFDKNYLESQLRLSDSVYKEELQNSQYYQHMVVHILD